MSRYAKPLMKFESKYSATWPIPAAFDKHELHYTVWSAPRPPIAVLFFFHGMMQHSASPELLALYDGLVARDVWVYGLDMPGHGKSCATGTHGHPLPAGVVPSYNQFRKDAARFVLTVTAEPELEDCAVFVAGFSKGALTAIEVAASVPSVRGAIVFASPLTPRPQKSSFILPSWIRSLIAPLALKLWAKAQVPPTMHMVVDDVSGMDCCRQDSLRLHRASLQSEWSKFIMTGVERALGLENELIEWTGNVALSSLQMPLLVVHGIRDALCPVTNALHAASSSRSESTRLVLLRSSHNMFANVHCQDELIREVCGFVSKQLLLKPVSPLETKPVEPCVLYRMPRCLTCSVSPRHNEKGLNPHAHEKGSNTMMTFKVPIDPSCLIPLMIPHMELLENSITIRAMKMCNIDWLAGGSYDLTHLTIPVRYRGEVMALSVAMWESAADPILTGREELGFPKRFADHAVWSEGDMFGVTLSKGGVPFMCCSGMRSAQTVNSGDAQERTHAKEINAKLAASAPDTCMLRVLPLEQGAQRAQLIRARAATNMPYVYEAYSGVDAKVCFPEGGHEDPLLKWVSALLATGAPTCSYARSTGTPAFMDQAVLDSVGETHAAPLARLICLKDPRELFAPRAVDRVVLRCDVDLNKLKELEPSACSPEVTVEILTRTSDIVSRCVRVSVRTAESSEMVLVQFDDDVDRTCALRENAGAPAVHLKLEVLGDHHCSMHVRAVWTLGDRETECFIIKANWDEKQQNAVAHERRVLLHDYAMPVPGEWGRFTPGSRLVPFVEESRVTNQTAVLGSSITFLPVTRTECATMYMLFAKLASLSLEPSRGNRSTVHMTSFPAYAFSRDGAHPCTD